MVPEAKRFRKRFGGAMRQAGILASAALFALRNNRERMKDDHASARAFAESIAKVPGASVDLSRVETNIVNVDLDRPAAPVVAAAKADGLLVNASGPKRIRVVTHLDAPLAKVLEAAAILARAIGKAA
jgi:threonine aldolase